MGEYYQFYNATRDEASKCPCKYNFGLQWGKSPERFSDKERVIIFESMIEGNGWSKDDEIIAEGDYGTKFVYQSGDVSYA